MSESKLEKKGRYQKYTQNWQNLIEKENVLEISKHLNSGFSFAISNKEYEVMKKNDPKYVHYYFSVSDEGKFTILVTDDVSDKEKIFHNVTEKKLTNSLSGNKNRLLNKSLFEEREEFEIDSKEALTRSFRWNLFSEDWLRSKITQIRKNKMDSNKVCFALIRNPFEDLKNVFEAKDSSGTKNGEESVPSFAHHFFGLKNGDCSVEKTENKAGFYVDKMYNYSIDIIVTNFVTKNNIKKAKVKFSDHSMCLIKEEEIQFDKSNYSLLK